MKFEKTQKDTKTTSRFSTRLVPNFTFHSPLQDANLKDWMYEKNTEDIQKPSDMEAFLKLVGWG